MYDILLQNMSDLVTLILSQNDRYCRKSTRTLTAFAVPLCEFQSSEHFASDLRAVAHRIETFANPRDRSSASRGTESSSAKLARSALSYSYRYAFPRGIYTCELRLLHAGDQRTNHTRPRYICMRETPASPALMDE